MPKFSIIKNKKSKNDAQKGRMFTKIGREIAVCVKDGGADPTVNFKLKDIIAKAKSNGMATDTINNCIKRSAGEGDNIKYEYITYEGYGPNGIAVIVDALTDNKNRTAANVRSAFTKGNGNMGTTGCVSFMFDKKGQIIIDKEETDMDEDELMMIAIDAGADDFIAQEDCYEIITTPEAFSEVYAAIEQAEVTIEHGEITMIPQTNASIADENVKFFIKMMDLLENDDDVQQVHHNCDNFDH